MILNNAIMIVLADVCLLLGEVQESFTGVPAVSEAVVMRHWRHWVLSLCVLLLQGAQGVPKERRRGG